MTRRQGIASTTPAPIVALWIVVPFVMALGGGARLWNDGSG